MRNISTDESSCLIEEELSSGDALESLEIYLLRMVLQLAVLMRQGMIMTCS